MSKLGTMQSKRWGTVNVMKAYYGEGQVAIVLMLPQGERLDVLSVNMYWPECSHDSRTLPAGCFYVRDWNEHATLADEAFATGLFIKRDDLPRAESGFITSPVWQIKGAV